MSKDKSNEKTFTRAERKKIKDVEDFLKNTFEKFQEYYIKNTDRKTDGIIYEMDSEGIIIFLDKCLRTWYRYVAIWNKRPEKKRLIKPKKNRLEKLIEDFLKQSADRHWYESFIPFLKEYRLLELGFDAKHIHNYYIKHRGITCKDMVWIMINDATNDIDYYFADEKVISKYNLFRGILREFRSLWAWYMLRVKKSPYSSCIIPTNRISIGYGIVNDIGEFRFPLPDRTILKEYNSCLTWSKYINTLEIHIKKEDK